jgi:hypothetical protein
VVPVDLHKGQGSSTEFVDIAALDDDEDDIPFVNQPSVKQKQAQLGEWEPELLTLPAIVQPDPETYAAYQARKHIAEAEQEKAKLAAAAAQNANGKRPAEEESSEDTSKKVKVV